MLEKLLSTLVRQAGAAVDEEELQVLQKVAGELPSFSKEASGLIPILQAIQDQFNYLPEEALRRVCETTSITPENITGVASFYSQFRMEPAP